METIDFSVILEPDPFDLSSLIELESNDQYSEYCSYDLINELYSRREELDVDQIMDLVMRCVRYEPTTSKYLMKDICVHRKNGFANVIYVWNKVSIATIKNYFSIVLDIPNPDYGNHHAKNKDNIRIKIVLYKIITQNRNRLV